MSQPGIEPLTSRFPKRTLYQLSYRGWWVLLYFPLRRTSNQIHVHVQVYDNFIHLANKPRHSKTNKMTDQPAHPYRLIILCCPYKETLRAQCWRLPSGQILFWKFCYSTAQKAVTIYLSWLMWKGHLSHRQRAKIQASLCIRLCIHIHVYGGRFTKKHLSGLVKQLCTCIWKVTNRTMLRSLFSCHSSLSAYLNSHHILPVDLY